VVEVVVGSGIEEADGVAEVAMPTTTTTTTTILGTPVLAKAVDLRQRLLLLVDELGRSKWKRPYECPSS
jgi:uncharacterized alkaline shock family protein YloU